MYKGLGAKSTGNSKDCERSDETKLERTWLLKVSVFLKFEITFLRVLKDNLPLWKDDGAVDRRKHKASTMP